MHGLIVLLIAISMPFSIWSALNALAAIAVRRKNPVIDLVEEYRKKYPDTNEN